MDTPNAVKAIPMMAPIVTPMPEATSHFLSAEELDQFAPVLIPGTDTVDWLATGKRCGDLLVAQAVNVAEGAIGLLMEYGNLLKGQPAAKTWLQGYGDARGKTQKYEATAVFEAIEINLDAAETAVLETVGTGTGTASRYHQFVLACRKIRGIRPGGRSPGTPVRVTSKQLDLAVTATGRMDGSQAVQIMQAGVRRVSSLHMGELLIVRQIAMIAESLGNNTDKPEFKAYAAKVREEAIDLVTRVENALDEAKVKVQAAEASKGIVPTPAMAHGPVETPTSAQNEIDAMIVAENAAIEAKTTTVLKKEPRRPAAERNVKAA